MTKLELRKKYKALRDDLSIDTIDALSIDIANQALKLNIWSHSFYHIFLSITELKEINTDYLLNILSGKDKNIIIPRSNFKTGHMNHVLLTDNTTIKKNTYHIPEPIDGIEINSTQIEVVFIPLLAFDQAGNRVGYGKGFYDTFLETCKPNTLKIGLSLFNAEPVISDVYTKDIPLDFCITPKQVYTF